MHRLWSWFTVSGLLAVTVPAPAATVLERNVLHTVQAGGGVREKTRLRIRLESEKDLRTWTSYSIYLDENRHLVDVEARAKPADGKEIRIRAREHDTREVVSSGEVHSSTRLYEIPLPPLTVGSLVSIDYEVVVRPYFPAGLVVLAGDEVTEDLRIEVQGRDQPGWRFRVHGPQDGLEIRETATGVVVSARDLPALDPPILAPDEGVVTPVLRYGWGEEDSWRAVGVWYEGIVEPVPRVGDTLRQAARQIVAGTQSQRAQLEALLAWVRQKVRYEAVEVGIGGYRPSPPAEVLERKWGDCKDKAFLLIDLLDSVGIEAYPALILSSRRERIDPAFPSPQFNHAIVAVPSQAVATTQVESGEDPQDLPTAGGYLFLDATQTRGALRWLQPAVQDQQALVVRGEESALVRTPVRPGLESRRLVVVLNMVSGGTARGGAGLAVTGRLADAFADTLASSPQPRIEESVRSLFESLLPQVRFSTLAWDHGTKRDLPEVSFSAGVSIEGLVEGEAARRSFRLPTFRTLPEPSLVSERQVPVVLSPGSTEISWRIALPEDWCPPRETDVEVANQVGSFRQSVTGDGRSVIVKRKTEIRKRWLEPEHFSEFQELSLAEYRASRRRIRLQCKEASPTG